MPRPIVLANPSLYIGFDDRGRLRDLHYPQRGLYDHLSGRMIRMGVWASNHFSWCDEGDWICKQTYRPKSMNALQTFTSKRLGIHLEFEDAVHPTEAALIRRLQVKNMAHHSQDVRVFFNHDLILAESDVGNTALYHPAGPGVVHFKGPHAILCSADSLYQYHTGVRFGDNPGTWQDAEDGELSGKPVEQGAVDSTISVRFEVLPGATAQTDLYLCCGASVEKALEVRKRLEGPAETQLDGIRSEELQQSKPAADLFAVLPDEVAEFCKHSLRILMTQIDSEGGITAANDSDIMIGNRGNYSYVWPRDGSLVAQVLDMLGESEASRRYFEFCNRLEILPRGTFLQKYRVDGTLGATWHPWLDYPTLPMQEDETALTLMAMRDHLFRNEGSGEHFGPMVQGMIQALLHHIDPASGLPLPSYDLWEERLGVHTFTVGTVIAGLHAGQQLLKKWSLPGGETAKEVADHMRNAMCQRLFDKDRGGFYRMLAPDGSPDKTVDSSTLQIALMGVLPVDDPHVLANQNLVRKRLTVRSEIGGLARYENDWSWRLAEEHTGNPWVISTMWMAQLKILQANSTKDLKGPLDTIRWARRLSGSTGVLAEQYHPNTGAPLSVSPLTWSHAELLRTAAMWSSRKLELG